MRIKFTDLNRPKMAARLLCRGIDRIKLSSAQEAIARATGYRNWRDLHVETDKCPQATESCNASQAAQLILSISDSLDLEHGDVQYALHRSQLLGSQSLEDALKARTIIWRSRLFGPPVRHKMGTIIRVKAHGSSRAGYLKSIRDTADIIYDTGFGMCADFEVVTPRKPLEDFAPSRLWLPYGYWTLRDGSTVTFARDYKPMWKVKSALVERMDPWLWIDKIVEETHFSTIVGTVGWSYGPAKDLALKHLHTHKISGVPKLLDAMPYLFDPKVRSIDGAVKRMKAVEMADES